MLHCATHLTALLNCASAAAPRTAPPQVLEVHEQEWSYIPVGGPLPLPDQPVAAFGAAAGLVHPATGYSITRSLREAPAMAAAVRQALAEQPSSAAAARWVWEALWTQERRRQVGGRAVAPFVVGLLCAASLHLNIIHQS